MNSFRQFAFTAISFCLLLILSNSLLAADQEADHDALRNLVKLYEQAVADGNPAALQPYLADEFTGVMVTGEEVDSFDSLSDYWNKIQSMIGEGGTYRVKVTVPELATIDGDWAISHGTTADTVVTSDNDTYEFEGIWTAVCRKGPDGWKIVRIHGSMDALTNTFVTTAIASSSKVAGAAGGLVGFLIGAVVVWLLGRRRRAQVTSA